MFDWLTSPSFPSLRTRTEMFLFFAPCWVAFESAQASCSFAAACPTVWEPEPGPPPWVCIAPCFVSFTFAASEPASTVLLWVTEPLLPGLKTRTSMF